MAIRKFLTDQYQLSEICERCRLAPLARSCHSLGSQFMNRCWCFPDPSSQKAASRLARQLDLVPALGSILARMGLAEETAARQFLFPRLRDLRDPFEIAGVCSAVDRIFSAVDCRQRIVLYGDYDVDGVTSVAL